MINRNILKTKINYRDSAMMWGRTFRQEMIPLVVVNGNLAAQHYVDDILRPTAPSFLRKPPRGVINQHHSTRPPHSQNRTKPLRSLHRQRVAVSRMLATGGGTNLRGRAFAHGAMGRRIDPSWGGSIELFLVPASAPRLV